MSLIFHSLKLVGREQAAEDAVCLRFAVPAHLREAYPFEPGQHVAFRATLYGREVRRTYSITQGSTSDELRFGIRVQGAGGLSHYLAHEAQIGDAIEALTPSGRFKHSIADGARFYLAVACGSGITPILSILTSVLENESASQFLLLYGNQTSARAMFKEELLALKNRFLGRFSVHFFMSREPQELELFNGRIGAEKLRDLSWTLFDPLKVDDVFLCGPGDLVEHLRDTLHSIGVQAPIHFEHFTSVMDRSDPTTKRSDSAVADELSAVTVIQDGRRRKFSMLSSDASILEAAERAGLELPFSCRSGVCSTCRARVVSGQVTLAHNVALEDWELAAGFTLCCQARPTSRELELTYDEK